MTDPLSKDELMQLLRGTDRLSREDLERSHVSILMLRDEMYLYRLFFEGMLTLSGDLVSLAKETVSLKEEMGQTREAIKSFDESSRRLTGRLVGLTVALVILTLVIAGFTILLWKRG